MDELETLMVEREELFKKRFTILKEISYNAAGEVEWDPNLAKPPGGGGGITRDTGPGIERRKRAASTPRLGDVVLSSDEQGRVLPVVITDVDQHMGIVQNKKSGINRKVDLTTLRPAQGEIAKRFAVKYPNRTFWQAS